MRGRTRINILDFIEMKKQVSDYLLFLFYCFTTFFLISALAGVL